MRRKEQMWLTANRQVDVWEMRAIVLTLCINVSHKSSRMHWSHLCSFRAQAGHYTGSLELAKECLAITQKLNHEGKQEKLMYLYGHEAYLLSLILVSKDSRVHIFSRIPLRSWHKLLCLACTHLSFYVIISIRVLLRSAIYRNSQYHTHSSCVMQNSLVR